MSLEESVVVNNHDKMWKIWGSQPGEQQTSLGWGCVRGRAVINRASLGASQGGLYHNLEQKNRAADRDQREGPQHSTDWNFFYPRRLGKKIHLFWRFFFFILSWCSCHDIPSSFVLHSLNTQQNLSGNTGATQKDTLCFLNKWLKTESPNNSLQ